jgi:imidazoleglycerol phosphate synthase glutamine amidotransferase subunit HisH
MTNLKQPEFDIVKDIPINQIPKIGRVYFCHEYFVDLNNTDMVQEAKECLYEDIMSMVKNQEVYECIGTGEAPEATYNDIPEFLKEEPFEL